MTIKTRKWWTTARPRMGRRPMRASISETAEEICPAGAATRLDNEIYVREEIAKVLRADGVTLEDGECCPPWTKAAWAKSPQAAVPAETSEDDKTPARRKLIKRVLPVAVASTALGVAAFK